MLKPIKETGPGGIQFQLRPRGNKYQLRYTNPRTGRQREVSTGTSLMGEARVFAAQDIQTYALDANDPTRVTVDDLMADLLQDYGENTRNYREVKRAWELRMKPIFGHIMANDVRTTDIRDYKAWCAGQRVTSGLFQGVKPYVRPLAKGTINRDLACLCRAFNFGRKGERITKMPSFEKYDNRKARRRGFLAQAEFDRILQGKMPVWMRALLEVLYAVGIRIDEARNITVGQLDFAAKVIRLEETKNGDPRTPPMTSRMYQLLLACAEGKSDTDYVFTRRNGDKVGDIKKTWHHLVFKASIGRRVLIHDLRRSAVKNMVERGVSEKVAMTISGHLTRYIFDAYNITCLSDQQKAAKLIEAGADKERAELVGSIKQPSEAIQ